MTEHYSTKVPEGSRELKIENHCDRTLQHYCSRRFLKVSEGSRLSMMLILSMVKLKIKDHCDRKWITITILFCMLNASLMLLAEGESISLHAATLIAKYWFKFIRCLFICLSSI